MENTLSELMQARLDKWRKNTLPNTKADKVFGRNLVEQDPADEDKLFMKEKEAWMKQLDSDPRNYRR